MKGKSLRNKTGSAMVAAIFVAVVIGLWMAAAMQSSFTEYKMSTRYLNMQNALNLAESGLEEGVRGFNDGSWSGWTAYSNGYYKSMTAPWVGNGTTGEIKIFVSKSTTSPTIAAEGSLTGADGRTLSRQIKVDLSSSSLFANGLLARRNVIMNGNGVTVDSWDSRVGNYSSSTRASNGNVASLALLNTDILLNNADIYGYISVGGTFDVNASFHRNGTLGEWGDAGGSKDLTRVTEDFYAELPPVVTPSYGSWTDVSTINGGSSDINDALTLGNPLDTSPARYQAERINLSGNGDNLVIDGPVELYVRRNVSISGKGTIRITPNGSLTLYSAESLSISGNGSAYGMQNETMKAEKFMIYNTTPYEGGTSVDVGGNGLVYAVIYAPNSNVHLHGGGSGGSVSGAIVGYEITLSGGYEFHYDEALADLAGGGGLNIDFWRELKAVGERLPFGDPVALNASF
ncbi:hypothetical protein [Pelagicoccus sp. SDUM812005]|uniref:pilus assembly PilX family protein n=1 Tax=Pelagicoccus sp. SDUM812005 TaxID=3041257 RepID=UPI00280D5014|nr:hypothetical protein [Pelagicoccus sp. SDUM812005]MDQ8183402.1 hypothetical protein [Pelagicoccus sp. SDUM812005]